MLNIHTLGIIARFISLHDISSFCLVNSEWNFTIELFEYYSVFWVEKQINFLEQKVSLYDVSIENSKEQAPTISLECTHKKQGGSNRGYYFFRLGYSAEHIGMKHPKFFYHRLKDRIHYLKNKISSLKLYKNYGYEGFSKKYMRNVVYYEYYWLSKSLNSYLTHSRALPYYIEYLCEDLELNRWFTHDTEDSLQLAVFYLLKLIKADHHEYKEKIFQMKPLGRFLHQ